MQEHNIIFYTLAVDLLFHTLILCTGELRSEVRNLINLGD
jgi:hypothetical protein